MSKKQEEQKFLNIIRKEFKRHKQFFYKVPDTLGQRFTPAKPCDAFSGVFGHLVAIEGKFLDGYQAFGMRHIQESQIEGLNAAIDRGCMAYIFLEIKVSPRLRIFKFWDWEYFRGLCAGLGGRSLDKEIVESTPGIEKVGGHYDIEPFLIDIKARISKN